MRKYTKLMAFLLSLALFAVTPISVLATDGTDQGVTEGVTGDTDNTGDTGDTGDTENTGNTGDTEDTGNTGDSGNTGDTDNTGDMGSGEAAAGDYTYKVRIYAGNQGSFSEGNPGVIEHNGVVESSQLEGKCYVKLNEPEKYYVRGIRESGRDNDTVPVGAAASAPDENGVSAVDIQIPVDGDRDYVVAYGVRGNMVNYTVTYKDSAGNELIPSRTFEGKIGDKQIVPYQYIEGYRPNAYSMAKTLEEDASKNVFPFVYTLVTAQSGGTIGEGGERVSYVDNGTTVIRNPAAGEGGTSIVDGGTAVIAGDGAGGGGAAQGAEVIGDEQIPLGEPEQLIDLDDEEVPLAEGSGIFGIGGNASLLGIPLTVIGVIVLVIAGSLWYAFVYMKKKKKETES